MDIRHLTLGQDREVVASLFSNATDYVLLETGRPPDSGTVDEFFDERPPNVGPSGAVHFGAFEAEQVVGILGMTFGYPEETDAYIGLLLLSEDARGRGLGSEILAAATNVARRHGAKRQFIAVLDENPKGRAFWEREGFEFEQTFPPTDDAHKRHRMVREV